MAKRLTTSAKVTSKGQITLPLALRRELGIHAGDRFRFESNRAGAHPRVAHGGDDPFAKYAGIGYPGLAPGRKGLGWRRLASKAD